MGIASRFGVTVEELARLNHIANPDLIFVGQELLVPAATGGQSAGQVPPETPVGVPILMYHHVRLLPANANSIERGLTVLPYSFLQELDYLVSQRYTTVGLQDLLDASAGKKSLPAKPVILTFDDGYEDAYSLVFPALRQRGCTATFFVLSGLVGSPGYLSWDQVKAMSDAGMEMEAHGVIHLDLTRLSASGAAEQMRLSKEQIETHTGKRVDFYCYPSGRYNASTVHLLESNGYVAAVTTDRGIASASYNPFR
ncbi:MAG: polysaccharide deacetylase family protein, partial [Chloroflexi bacterium]|nr:polysaccharide deacetylase family protein [Chloroflexota bacterium]